MEWFYNLGLKAQYYNPQSTTVQTMLGGTVTNNSGGQTLRDFILIGLLYDLCTFLGIQWCVILTDQFHQFRQLTNAIGWSDDHQTTSFAGSEVFQRR